MKPSPSPSTSSLPDLPCACATARRATRLVTQLYGEHLRKHDLEPTQLSLLTLLQKLPGKSQTAVTRVLGIDKTTLSRNLKLMQKNGWVYLDSVPRQNELGLFLTTAGVKLVKASQPDWKRAQDQLRSAMTAAEWDAMWNGLRLLSRAAAHAREPHI
jgi:DNA-binding MarR family transcriptional regulator